MGGGHKKFNATERAFTKDLTTTTRSQAVLDRSNAAMDLYYHVEGGPNPAWDAGKALEVMWKEALTRAMQDDDRQETPILNITLRRTHSLHATYTTDTISTAQFDSL